MAFDWKRLERERNEQQDRLLLPMGIMNVVMAVAGLVIFLITGRMGAAIVVWALIGVPLVIMGLRLRRRGHR